MARKLASIASRRETGIKNTSNSGDLLALPHPHYTHNTASSAAIPRTDTGLLVKND